MCILRYIPRITAIAYLVFWAVFGIPFLSYYFIHDIVNFIKLLIHTSSDSIENLDSEKSEDADKVLIYNEILTIFIAIDELFK